MEKGSDRSFELEFETAKKAAISAGTHILRMNRDQIMDERGRDIKHKADLESEKIIIDMLNEATDYPVLTEECGELGHIDLPSMPGNDALARARLSPSDQCPPLLLDQRPPVGRQHAQRGSLCPPRRDQAPPCLAPRSAQRLPGERLRHHA